MAKGDIRYLAIGVKKWDDGTEHVVCCGVFYTKGGALTALEDNGVPALKRNIVAVFEDLPHCINVFAI